MSGEVEVCSDRRGMIYSRRRIEYVCMNETETGGNMHRVRVKGMVYKVAVRHLVWFGERGTDKKTEGQAEGVKVNEQY